MYIQSLSIRELCYKHLTLALIPYLSPVSHRLLTRPQIENHCKHHLLRIRHIVLIKISPQNVRHYTSVYLTTMAVVEQCDMILNYLCAELSAPHIVKCPKEERQTFPARPVN